MVVAMVAMRMVEMSIHQIVHMVAMRHGGMAAIRAVNVFGGVFRGGKSRRALVGIGRADGNCVFVHVVAVRMMQMAIVEIIHVPFMLDSGVPAAGAVDMGVIGVSFAGM
jgi:hypothetical protein